MPLERQKQALFEYATWRCFSLTSGSNGWLGLSGRHVAGYRAAARRASPQTDRGAREVRSAAIRRPRLVRLKVEVGRRPLRQRLILGVAGAHVGGAALAERGTRAACEGDEGVEAIGLFVGQAEIDLVTVDGLRSRQQEPGVNGRGAVIADRLTEDIVATGRHAAVNVIAGLLLEAILHKDFIDWAGPTGESRRDRRWADAAGGRRDGVRSCPCDGAEAGGDCDGRRRHQSGLHCDSPPDCWVGTFGDYAQARVTKPPLP